MNRIKVNLEKKQSKSYDIYIGQDILDRAGLLLAKNNWAARYIIVTDSKRGDPSRKPRSGKPEGHGD